MDITDTVTDALLPIARLHRNETQPREYFDQAALDELATSIAQVGVLQSLLVRPDGDNYVIVAGERRWRASQQAGLKEVPCRVLGSDISDEEAFVLSVTENAVRRDMTPIEDALAYKRVMEDFGKTVAETAAMFGKQPQWVQWRLDLLRLTPEIQHLVAHGQIARNAGWYISNLSDAGQLECLRKINAGTFVNDEAICDYAQAVQVREASGPGMFEGAGEVDVLAAARRKRSRDKIEVTWDKINGLASAFGPFNELSPAELAAACGDKTALYFDRIALLLKAVKSTQILLRQAKAHRAAMVEAESAVAEWSTANVETRIDYVRNRKG